MTQVARDGQGRANLGQPVPRGMFPGRGSAKAGCQEGELPMNQTKKSSRSYGPTGESMTVECVFCKATGTDPYEVLSRMSKCPVCNGRTKVEVRKPAYPCAYCHGTGKQRHNRLTCSACKGTGHITVAGPTTKCPECRGNGRAPGPDLSCSLCRGAGLIAGKSTGTATVTAQDVGAASPG